MDEPIEFGMRMTKTSYDRYIGEYVLIQIHGNGGISGKVKGLEESHLVLNPFQTSIYDKSGKAVYLIREKDKIVNLREIAIVEPVELEDIENYCKAANSRNNPQINFPKKRLSLIDRLKAPFQNRR